MTRLVIPAGEDITVHLSGGDTSWYAAVTNPTSGETLLADSATEAVAGIIDGYDPSDPESAFEQRLQFAVFTTAFQQGILALAAVQEGTLNVDEVGEDVLTALFGDRVEPAEVASWDLAVPLLHVASHYAPYTELPQPTGANVHLIDPYTEVTLLLSLHAAGSLEVAFRDEDIDEDIDFAA